MMEASAALPRVTEEFVIQKCDYFASVQLWPLKEVLDPERWLKNFTGEEVEYAVHLLNQFLYFAEPLVDSIFAAAFQGLSRELVKPGDPLKASRQEWRSFVDSVIIVHVTGEIPSPADSGYSFARKSRRILGIRQDQIMDSRKAIETLRSNSLRPVVFVDDFVGTGNQFRATWERENFRTVASDSRSSFYYCPAFCTERGARELERHCPEVKIRPGHFIPARYSAVARDSILWRPDQVEGAIEFLRRASARAGIPDTGGTQVNDWQGFWRLGLAFAFHNSVPDATLPIFYWSENGWQPLIPRT